MKSKEIKKDLLNFVKGGKQEESMGPSCNPKFYYADSIYVKRPKPNNPKPKF